MLRSDSKQTLCLKILMVLFRKYLYQSLGSDQNELHYLSLQSNWHLELWKEYLYRNC